VEQVHLAADAAVVALLRFLDLQQVASSSFPSRQAVP
jgi:hypothetical protein